ncbi:Sec-independent protein translocase protein TatB [Cardiobacteriaceae bacterium TAE3-ERU3]|nr:Sec-independent protein translocase protein TatB [Cardiobacteriaceae bacterium TAE3-ERU3]
MFDIGFWELATIAIIGIVVVGPERLPEVVRTVAAYVRKARRAFQDVKSDIERELDLDDIRRQMQEVDMEDHIKKLNQSVMDADRDVRKAVSRFDDDIRQSIDDLNDPEVRAVDERDSGIEYDNYDYDPHAADSEEYADTGVEAEPIHDDQASNDIADKPDSTTPPKQHD